MEKHRFFIAFATAVALTACSPEPTPVEPAAETQEPQATEPGGAMEGNAIFPPGAKAELVAPMEHVALEGSVWVPEGYLLFSDQTSNRIYKWADGNLSVFKEGAGYSGDLRTLGNDLGDLGLTLRNYDGMIALMLGPNGNTIDPEGRLVSCARADRAVVRYEKDGTRTVLASSYQGKRLQNPNDVIVKSDGSIYFSALGGRPASEAPPSGVYRWKDGVVDQLDVNFPEPYPRLPNGLAFSPDEKYLYVAIPAGHNRTYRYEVQADGTIANRQVFVDIGADGFRIDQSGNLYLSENDNLVVVSPEGTRLASLPVPGGITNMTFGGADRKTLFIVNEEGVSRVPVNIPGN